MMADRAVLDRLELLAHKVLWDSMALEEKRDLKGEMVLRENRDPVEQRAIEDQEVARGNRVLQETRAVLVKEATLALLERQVFREPLVLLGPRVWLVAREIRVYRAKEEKMENQEKLVFVDQLERLEPKEERVRLDHLENRGLMEKTDYLETKDPRVNEEPVVHLELRVSLDFSEDVVIPVQKDSEETMGPWEIQDLMGKTENRVQMANLDHLALRDFLDQRARMVRLERLEDPANAENRDLGEHWVPRVHRGKPEQWEQLDHVEKMVPRGSLERRG